MVHRTRPQLDREHPVHTRLAIHLNRAFERRGRLLDDRFHARALCTPLAVRRGLCYVLQNFRKHEAASGRKLAMRWLDPCSSGVAFDGWRQAPEHASAATDLGTLPARTWLLRAGWRRHGLIDIAEVPGGRGPPHPASDEA